MKPFFKTLAILLSLAFTVSAFTKDEKFEGTITYSMTVEDLGGVPPEAANMLKDMQMIYHIKAEHFRMDSKTMMSNTSVISDSKNQTAFTLMDMMGKKYLIKIKPEEIKKDADAVTPKIKLLDGTKEIAGYICKKAEITMNMPQSQGEVTTVVYYTDQIPNVNTYGAKFKGLDGFPLEYTVDTYGMKMKITATAVSKEKVEDAVFNVPDGYKETTLEQLQTEMKNSMSGK